MQWVNKFRPFQLDELAGQTLVKKACENVLTGKDDLLNMLFKGPPGTGKSCAVDILCRGLFGDELMKERGLSDKRIRRTRYKCGPGKNKVLFISESRRQECERPIVS